MTNSNFSKSKPPTANPFWGWNNVTKVVQSTNKVWHLHSSVLKKSTFSIKNEFGLIYCYFLSFQRYVFFDQLRNFGVFQMNVYEISGQIIIGGCKYYLKLLSPKYYGLNLHIGLRGSKKPFFCVYRPFLE